MADPTQVVAKKTVPNNYADNDSSILQEEVIDRSYAQSGTPIKLDPANAPTEEVIERVDFDTSNFQDMVIAQEKESDDEDDAEPTSLKNENLSDEEIKLNKSVQRKIAKSQSKNIVNIYCFLVLGAIKWYGVYDEDKAYKLAQSGDLSLTQKFADLSLIEHINNHNEHVRNLTIDEDFREAMQDALEIWMISKDIKTSPELNLAMAFLTPVIQLFMEASAQKRSIKKLVTLAMDTHQQSVVINTQLNNELLEKQRQIDSLKNQLDTQIPISKPQVSEAPIIPMNSASNSGSPSKRRSSAKTESVPLVKSNETHKKESRKPIPVKPQEPVSKEG